MHRYILTPDLAALGFRSTGVSFYHNDTGATVEYLGSGTNTQPWVAYDRLGEPLKTSQGFPRHFETAEAAARAALNLPRIR